MQDGAQGSEHGLGQATRGAGRLRVGLWIAALLLAAGLAELLTHRSTDPSVLGRWSLLYTAILLLNALAAAGCAALAQCPTRHAAALRLLRSPASWFWWGSGLLLTAWIASVYLRSDDTDFKHLAALLLPCSVLSWLAAAWGGERVRRGLTLALLPAGGVAAALLLVEGGLALFPGLAPGVALYREQQISFQRMQIFNRAGNDAYQGLLVADPVLGFEMRPNATAQVDYLTGATEGGEQQDGAGGDGVARTLLETDAWGFFNTNLDPTQPYDVAVVGDSFVMNYWPAKLAELTGLRVANLGRARYAPPQYTEVVRRYALRLHPRVIFYCLYLNDAEETADYLDYRASGLDWFEHKGGLWFGARESHPGRAVLRLDLTRASRLFNLLGLMAFKARQKEQGVQGESLTYRQGGLDLTFDPNSYGLLADPQRAQVQRGLEAIGTSLAEARALAESAGSELVVLLMPPKELVYEQALREVAPAGAPLENIAALYVRYRALAEAAGLRVFDLTEPFRAAAAARPEALYWPVDIHWNPRGGEQMAREAAGVLRQLGIAAAQQPAG